MAQNLGHVANGIEAVIDSAYITIETKFRRDIWVNPEDYAKALQQAEKLSNEDLTFETFAPTRDNGRIPLVLRK